MPKSDFIKKFCSEFSLSYRGLDDRDVDFVLLNNKGVTIAFANVNVVDDDGAHSSSLFEATLTSISKLQDKRLSPIVIWGFNDGIVFSKLMKLSGAVYCSKNHFGSDELMVRYDRQESMKCLRRH
jgi:hypothetical protein